MKFYSTNDKLSTVSLREAVRRGLPPDNGLYLPEKIPQLPPAFFRKLTNLTFPEISFEIARQFLAPDIADYEIAQIVHSAFDFPVPIVTLASDTRVLELYHGPTLAFKDFGARFMARLLGHWALDLDRELTILVATSGDTGSAVAHGFWGVAGTRVVILYPSSRVSRIQEQQLTTLGKNITALEIAGTFDDCQRLVKTAFLDSDLTAKMHLTSANSINIARLIPQSFYYFWGYRQVLSDTDQRVIFTVPSGNFGNLCGGILAKKMGLPILHFIAATNANAVFVDYLKTGHFAPRASVPTISNAMDVGQPSNFARLMDCYDHNLTAIRQDISAYSFSDDQTRQAIRQGWHEYGYVFDPHGAVGYLAREAFGRHSNTVHIILETAHPAKFGAEINPILPFEIDIPERLATVMSKKKISVPLSNEYADLKEYLLSP